MDRYLSINFGQNDKHKSHLVLDINSFHYSSSKSALARRWTEITKFCSHTFINQLWPEWWTYATLNQSVFFVAETLLKMTHMTWHNFSLFISVSISLIWWNLVYDYAQYCSRAGNLVTQSILVTYDHIQLLSVYSHESQN